MYGQTKYISGDPISFTADCFFDINVLLSVYQAIVSVVSNKAECIKINAGNKSNPDQQPKHFTAVALKLKI
ncbi:hypothetical protein T12_8750 [Trichinella patagoniensis]|uniref:Uncharacterized protein n=1 Tax=Trichinella patagoniensis TaxID=990121 RepID=A0A0V1A1W3_9BILA|nr:hypothetical protein T12_8750 [Trichinella patagoniensis]